MERYKVRIDTLAEEDVWKIVKHISQDLGEPGTAVKVRERIYREIFSLDTMPKRYALSRNPAFAQKGYRVTSVGKFLILYTVSVPARTVHIKRVVYGGADWPSQI